MNSIENLLSNFELTKPLTKKDSTDNNQFNDLNRNIVGEKPARSVVFSSQTQQANKILSHSLSEHLNLGEQRVMTAPAKNDPDSGFDVKAVANSVLSFVSESLQAAKKRGVNENELKTLFNQAQQGINKGFSEAIKELKELKLFDDDLEKSLDDTKSAINKGMDELQQQLLPEQKNRKLSDQLISTKQLFNKQHEVNQLSASQTYLSRSQSADLVIETADGDKVAISFNRLQQHARSGADQINKSEVDFSLSIQGELDDGELKAIESLMKDIDTLQKEFFSGDINQAFEKALKLGFDSKELAGFSLDLQQTKTSVASQRYAEVESLADNSQRKLMKELAPLAELLQQVENLQQDTEKVFGKKDVFGDLMKLVYETNPDSDIKHSAQLDTLVAMVDANNGKK